MIGLEHSPVSSEIYTELNEQIEFVSKILPYLVKSVVAALALFPLILTIVNYFVYDLGEDSYYLPCPIMYVYYQINIREELSFIQTQMFFFCSFSSTFESSIQGCHLSGKHRTDTQSLYSHYVQPLMRLFVLVVQFLAFPVDLVGYSAPSSRTSKPMYLFWILVD